MGRRARSSRKSECAGTWKIFCMTKLPSCSLQLHTSFICSMSSISAYTRCFYLEHWSDNSEKLNNSMWCACTQNSSGLFHHRSNMTLYKTLWAGWKLQQSTSGSHPTNKANNNNQVSTPIYTQPPSTEMAQEMTCTSNASASTSAFEASGLPSSMRAPVLWNGGQTLDTAEMYQIIVLGSL